MKKKTETTNTKSESKSKSKIVPSKKKKTTMTTNSKTTTKKEKSPYVRKTKRRQTDEEYMASYAENWKRENDYSIQLAARMRIYEAEKKKHDIQEFRNRCESLGYCFCPSEGKLIDYYLRSKYSDKEIDDYCPIEEVDVCANHPRSLIEHFLPTLGKFGYCFTRCSLDEIQSVTDTHGHWTFGKKEDVLDQGKKVGLKQVFEYCEVDHSTGFKIVEYKLDRAPADQKAWFICKLVDGESCLTGQN